MSAGELARAAIDRGAVKHPLELERLVDLIQKRPAPRTVLEIGVFHGGTLWLWRQLADARRGYVLGVDIREPDCEECDRGRAHGYCARRRVYENVWHSTGCEGQRFLGSSFSSEARNAIAAAFPAGEVDLIHVDGDHTRSGAWRDLELVAPYCHAGTVLVIDDVALEHDGGDILVAGMQVPAAEWGPSVIWEALRGAPGAVPAIAEPGGYGLGVVIGREWRHVLYEG